MIVDGEKLKKVLEVATKEGQFTKETLATVKHYIEACALGSDEAVKAYAEEHGYKMFKSKKREKYLPCMCGHNRRETWYDAATKETLLVCEKCRTVVRGKTDEEAKRNWNEVMQSATN